MRKTINFVVIFIFAIFNSFSESPFKLCIKKDIGLLGTGILLSGTTFVLDSILKFNRTEYNGEFYDKENINKIDSFFINPYSKKLDQIANFTAIFSMTTPLILASTEVKEWKTILVMCAETYLISNGVKELLKLSISRARPYMYYDYDANLKNDISDGNFCNSFPSGHTTLAFAGATFTTYTFSKYFPKSNWKIPIAFTSYALASTTAVLRMRSGNHFFTDVLAGAAIGSGIGFFVPFLHTFNKKNNLNISLSPTELSFKVKF